MIYNFITGIIKLWQWFSTFFKEEQIRKIFITISLKKNAKKLVFKLRTVTA